MAMLVEDYLPVAFFALLALGFAPLAWWLSRFIRPHTSSTLQRSTYECGTPAMGEAHIEFRYQYYIYAIVFVVFDLISVFLLVWAYYFSELSDTAIMWMLIFLTIVLIGVGYALRKEEKLWI